MNTLFLKIIAIISMAIDHYGAIFAPNVEIYRYIGRIAFPIFCFLLVEGFIHTKDIKKYGQRLIIFALISEIPFDLAFYGQIGFQHQNIFFTLYIGLVMIHHLEKSHDSMKKLSIISIAMIFAFILAVDYNIIGIMYIAFFYFTKDMVRLKRLPLIALLLSLVNLPYRSMGQQFSLLALPLLYFYNGQLGPSNKLIKWSFYIFYPLHLAVFYLLQIIQ